MPKTYFNDAIIGNSGTLVCLTGNGELVRLFWPHPDERQLFETFITGLYFKGSGSPTVWLHDQSWYHSQQYVPGTNILKTSIENPEKSLTIEQTDFVTDKNDVFIRRLKIKNTGLHRFDMKIMHLSSFVSNINDLSSVLYDFSSDSMIHYKSNTYAAIFSDLDAEAFQLGNNAYENALYDKFYGNDNIGMMKDGAVSWDLGPIEPGQVKEAAIYLCLNNNLSGLKQAISGIRNTSFSELYDKTYRYWQKFLNSARLIRTGRLDADELYKRSLLVFKLMCDEKTGGILAAPEIDEEFTRCGRYAYCWGRDAGFIAGALDACGLTELVDKFYDWALITQDIEGFWYQRYTLDGNLAPSWGLQIDETGTLLWGILQHYHVVQDKSFLEHMWPAVKKAIAFILDFLDKETGLPRLSFDLWEERYGVHAYSSAAVYGGIRAGIEIAEILGRSDDGPGGIDLSQEEMASIAEKLRRAIDLNFWKTEEGFFLRSIRTKLNPWENEPSEDTVVLPINPKGYKRDFTLEDTTVDSSLLGLSIPFRVYPSDCVKMLRTAERIETRLSSQAGGIRRYETDGYIGGNPWVVTSLWLGLHFAEIKDYQKALHYFDWAVKGTTGLGLLPEQLDKTTGKPAWVIPLTWSHAMYVLLLVKLFEAGCFD